MKLKRIYQKQGVKEFDSFLIQTLKQHDRNSFIYGSNSREAQKSLKQLITTVAQFN